MTQCSNKRRAAGLAYPRTCSVCGLGPCRETTALNPPEPTTNTVKHTPGPWRAIKAVHGVIDIFDSRDRDIVTIFGGGVGTESKEANAHLIAAAPDLLGALQALFTSYKELADSGDAGFWSLEDQPVGKQALAAISKAEAR